MFCSHCGEKLGDEDLFCSSCGTKIRIPNSNNEQAEPKEDIQTPLEKITASDSTYNASDAIEVDPIRPEDAKLAPPLNDVAISNAERSKNKRNYFTRHWRGELSLAISYWVNTVILGGLVMFVFTLAQTIKFFELYPYSGFSLVFVTFGFTVWQLVGLWRSASKYSLQPEAPVWGGVVKFLVIVGWLQNGAAASLPDQISVLSSIGSICFPGRKFPR